MSKKNQIELSNTDNTKILTLEGPFDITARASNSIAKSDYSDAKGIMFFTIPVNGKHFIEYIAHTNTTFQKYVQNLRSNVLRGEWRSLDRDAALNGEFKKIWNGLWRDRTKENEWNNQKNILKPNIKKFLDIIQVFVISVEDEDYPEQIKREFYWYFYNKAKNDPVVKFLPFDILVPRDKEILPYNKIEFENPEVIYGLPKEMKLNTKRYDKKFDIQKKT